MPTQASHRIAFGESDAKAPAGLHTKELAGSHDCELVVSLTGQGIAASCEAKADRALPVTITNRKVTNTMNIDTLDNLAPGEDGVQEQNSCPETTPTGSNVVAASCDRSPVIDGNIDSTTPDFATSESDAEAPADQPPNEQVVSHDCDLIKKSDAEPSTPASYEAKADGDSLPITNQTIHPRKEPNTMCNNTPDNLTPSEDGVQEQNSCPETTPMGSNAVVASCDLSSVIDGNIDSTTPVSPETKAGAAFATPANTAQSDESEQVSSSQAESPSVLSSVSSHEEDETSIPSDSITPSVPAGHCIHMNVRGDETTNNTTNTMSTNNDIPTVPADDESAATQMNNATTADVESATGSSTNTNAVAPVSEGESFDPILLSSGKPEDAMGVGSVTREIGGDAFAITKSNARIRVKVTADDSGTLTLRHQETQQEFSFGASLPEGEWPQLDNPDYWQTNVEREVPKGHYTVTGTVTNTGTAHSQNRIMMRYEIYLVAGDDVIEPIPPDEPEEETAICCACGGCEEKDGNGKVVATIDIPGESFMDQCFLKSQFEEMQQQTAAVSEGGEDATSITVSGGLKYTSAWNWKAAYDADGASISVTPPNGPALNFTIVEGSATAILTGNSRKYQYSMQLLDMVGNPVTSGTPAVLKLVAADGTQVRFNASSGDVLTIRTSSGRLVSAEQFGNNISIKTDGNKFIQSAYSAMDGLMLTTPQSNGSTQYAWYAPEQVTVVGGEYQTSGDPYKTENYLTTVTNGVKTTIITRQQAGLPAHTITRVENDNTTTITKGAGDEAIIRTIAKNYLGNNVMETIESVHRASDTTPASCTRKLELRTDGGWVILEQTEGYGSDVAQTTKYEYDSHFRVSRINYHNGGYIRYEYDSEGREVLAAEPWAGGYEKITRTTYADSRFYDNRPATVTEYRVNSAGSEVLFRTTTYTYEDSDAEEKVTTTVTAGGSSQQQVNISSNYGESASYAYAAGKAKFSQAVNGVQTWHDYEATTEHGAIHKHTVTTKNDGELVAAQSRKTESFIAANDTTVFEQESIWDGSQWLLLNTTAYEYDAQHRVTKTTRGNGRFTTTEWMCCGVLRQVDEDGIVTSNAYNSAHELTESSRSEVYDGDICVTPETITEYTRDAAGRVLSTTRRIGAMVTTEATEYDALGRVTKQVDVLGRETTTEYSEDSLTTTVTTPAGATFVTVQNTDGSTARIAGTGQREHVFVFDLNGNSERMTTKLPDGSILGQTITNGFGQMVVEARPNTLNGFIYTRSEFNAKGHMVKSYQDTGWNTEKTAATLYEYDSFGNQVKQTLALNATPTKDNSPVVELVHSVESADDGVYSVTTQTRYNAAGDAFRATQKQLISQLSATLVSKSISTDVRGNNSESWSEYTAPSKITSFNSIPTSEITAEAISVDGFTTSQKDNVGIVNSATRSYTASGMTLIQVDGRGNATTSTMDLAGRTICVTDAAGAVTTIFYDIAHDQPSVVTDSMGNTSCYKYDLRGRKIAEWGTALQPACFFYDDMDNMTCLRTFRTDGEDIITDPSERRDYDETIWAFNAVTGLEMSKTYADDTSVLKTYDAYNRLDTEMDARGNVKTHAYEHARGLHIGTTYNTLDGSTATAIASSFTYNHLGQMTMLVDDAGTRIFGYNSYGERATDSLVVDGDTHIITETRDSFGRSSGYTYAKNGTVQQTVSTGYGDDGRINSAGFTHGGEAKVFGYQYLNGSHLLHKLTKPNGMTLTQDYEATRDLLIGMAYHRGSTLVVQRTYTYDIFGRPTARNTARQGAIVNDTFTHNNRSELVGAQVNGKDYEYVYDNIGNRQSSMEDNTAVLYDTNELNQYASVSENGAAAFEAQFDADGNQSLIRTSTGIWNTVYNAENRPVSFTNSESNMVVECAYDSMGRRTYKKVLVNDAVTLHHRYIYRGYMMIACIDLLRSHRPVLWFITWDPSQPITSRPLAIQKDGTWYTYGWDLTKNICEIFNKNGYIGTQYTYTPFGITTTSGSVVQPVQHSSEVFDEEIGLTVFPLRYYNSLAARWISRDPALENGGYNLYRYVDNSPIVDTDFLGMFTLSKTVKNMLKNLGGSYDAKNDCKEFSTEAITKESPFFPILGIPTRLKFTGELAFKCCCDGMRIRNYLETSLNLELFMQIGYIKRKRDYYNLPRKRRRKMSKPGYIQRGIGNVPSAGASEMGNNASLSYKNLEKCPTERFELFDVDVYIFLRGAVGAWMGVYGDVTFNILGNEYVDENSVWSRFEASGGVAFGIYGASLAFGVGGSVSAKLLL